MIEFEDKYWEYHIEDDGSPMPFKVVRGETVFARCRSRVVANMILQYYQDNVVKEKDATTILPYE